VGVGEIQKQRRTTKRNVREYASLIEVWSALQPDTRGPEVLRTLWDTARSLHAISRAAGR
jgi:hypothetical protein